MGWIKMFEVSNLKIKSKIGLIFTGIIAMEIALFAAFNIGVGNATDIKEMRINMIMILLLSIIITAIMGLVLINFIYKHMRKINNIARKMLTENLMKIYRQILLMNSVIWLIHLNRYKKI